MPITHCQPPRQAGINYNRQRSLGGPLLQKHRGDAQLAHPGTLNRSLQRGRQIGLCSAGSQQLDGIRVGMQATHCMPSLSPTHAQRRYIINSSKQLAVVEQTSSPPPHLRTFPK